jgi:hypothetical protein
MNKRNGKKLMTSSFLRKLFHCHKIINWYIKFSENWVRVDFLRFSISWALLFNWLSIVTFDINFKIRFLFGNGCNVIRNQHTHGFWIFHFSFWLNWKLNREFIFWFRLRGFHTKRVLDFGTFQSIWGKFSVL